MFDLILSLEDGLVKVEKFEKVASSWKVDLKDLCYFTDSLEEIDKFNILDKNKVFGCPWYGIDNLEKMEEVLPENRILKSPKDLLIILSQLL